MSEVEDKPKDTRSGRGVTCSKCSHVNPPGSNTCGRCGARLYVVCHECGKSNARVWARCENCGHRLHRGRLERMFRKVGKEARYIKPLHVVLFLVGLALVTGLIVFFSMVSLPNFWR